MSHKYQQTETAKKELISKSDILNLLLRFQNTVFTKDQLCATFNMSERAVRSELEKIANYYPIRATAGRKGYSLISFREDYDVNQLKEIKDEAYDQIRELQNRIDCLKARMKPLIALTRATAELIQEKETFYE